MQVQELGFRDFAKGLPFVGRDSLLRPGSDVSGGLRSWHTSAHNLGDHRAQRVAVPQPERVRLTERLPDRRIARGRALVRPS